MAPHIPVAHMRMAPPSVSLSSSVAPIRCYDDFTRHLGPSSNPMYRDITKPPASLLSPSLPPIAPPVMVPSTMAPVAPPAISSHCHAPSYYRGTLRRSPCRLPAVHGPSATTL
ncbi:hypothetical protein MRX96_016315 [Rhipicephalus microplus]